jgi:hypothetical protein
MTDHQIFLRRSAVSLRRSIRSLSPGDCPSSIFHGPAADTAAGAVGHIPGFDADDRLAADRLFSPAIIAACIPSKMF